MALTILLAGATAAVLLHGWAGRGERVSVARPGEAVAGAGVEARHARHDGRSFTLVTLDLNRVRLDLFWKRPDGSRYARFRSVESGASRDPPPLLFAANAGIFDPSFTPLGLHVEEGKPLTPLNTADGTGNFFLKPNGVFLIDAGGDARVVESAGYAGLVAAGAAVRVATQSGPLLVAGGRVHPAFRADSASLRVRNGVGVAAPRRVVFALSDEPVSFDDLARLFRDEAGCRDALYLDGVISRFYAPAPSNRAGDGAGDFAGIFAAFPLASGACSRDHP